MSMKLVHKPRSAKRMHDNVTNTVRTAMEEFANGVVKPRLESDVKTWDEKPVFTVKVKATKEQWILEARVNRKSRVGKNYTRVDEGTGSRGDNGGTDYPIKPKKRKTGMLVFYVPHSPKSMPNPPVPDFPSNDTPHIVKTKIVMHPGIYPRHFTKSIRDELMARGPGSFRNMIEAAVKRGLRKS